MKIDENDLDIYPCTIINDRYGGIYSDAQWLAFYCDHDQVPEAVNGGDVEEMEFWWSDEPKKWLIGKGKTPHDALKDLIKYWNEKYGT